MTMNTENRVMPGIAVALLTEDREQSVVLNSRVESTNLARTVLSHVGFPAGPGDTVLRQLLDQRAEVVLVNIDPQNPQRAIRTIELIHATFPESRFLPWAKSTSLRTLFPPCERERG